MPPVQLDPDAAAHLDRQLRLGPPRPETLSPEAIRAAESLGLTSSAPPRVSVGAVADYAAEVGGVAVRGRLYRPDAEAAAAAGPGLVYFHGGGWVVGSLDTHDHICRYLCRHAGITVLSVDYPLAPESPFPAAPECAVAALEHVFQAADALGLDPERIAIGGDSAGANLSAGALLAARAAGRRLPRAQLHFYPAMDLTLSRLAPENVQPGDVFTEAAIRWYLGLYLGGADPRDPRASPLLAKDLGGLPPAYVLTAGADPLAPDGAAFADRLEAEGVSVVRAHFPGQAHGFLRSPQVIPTAWTALNGAAEFLLDALVGAPRA